MTASYDAVVLAGGRSTRMQVTDKTTLVVGERTMLDRVLTAAAGAETVAVVGPVRETALPVAWLLEDPPGGGPVAAAVVGLAVGTAPYVALLAADLPLLTARHLDRLRTALEVDAGADGAVYVDAAGRPQWLCGMWRRESLVRATEARAGSMRAALDGLSIGTLTDDEPGRPGWLDCDTPEDLHRVEMLLA